MQKNWHHYFNDDIKNYTKLDTLKITFKSQYAKAYQYTQ